jgi:uncharacterized protein (UPF0332 family)
VERDLKDASLKGLSPDRRFTTAYNAILQAATAILRCGGYRTTGKWHHATTFQALRHVLGEEHHETIDHFDACRSKRNITDYDRAGEVSRKEADELLREARNFNTFVRRWISDEHPELAP